MSEVQFYTYSIDEPLSRIAARLANAEALSDSDLRTLGAFFLPPYLQFVPAAGDQQVRAEQTLSVAAFDRLLYRACDETTAWREATEDASASDRLDSLYRSDTFNTTQLLGLTYYALFLRPRQEIAKTFTKGPMQLLKKFEVFGRIFTSYTSEFRKAAERFDVPLNYALLSLLLLELYERNQDLPCLNTALKLNDLLIAIENELESLSDLSVAFAALCYGKSLVEKFYGSRGFRLPTNQ